MCITQWRQNMAGVTGLDYVALESVMNMQNIKRKQRKSVFNDIRAIESGALSAIAKVKTK